MQGSHYTIGMRIGLRMQESSLFTLWLLRVAHGRFCLSGAVGACITGAQVQLTQVLKSLGSGAAAFKSLGSGAAAFRARCSRI